MKKIVFALLTVSLGGCASVKAVPAPPQVISDLQGGALTIVTHAKPSFIAMTPGKGAFAMMGAFAAIADGNKLVETYQIPDPAHTVTAKLTPVLQDKFKTSAVKTISDLEEKITSDTALAAAAERQGVVLDVVTVGWGYSYFPLNWGRYNIGTNVNARLIDARSGKVIAQSHCIPPKEQQANFPAPEPDKAPTHDEMMADNAALIKATIIKNADTCAAIIQKNMFGGW
ncbi:MAG TPA: hypothetical protein VJS47_01955 [Rhizomicrobium sp.]|nr:hypothetical protein [Rhizomicrobium sp.]